LSYSVTRPSRFSFARIAALALLAAFPFVFCGCRGKKDPNEAHVQLINALPSRSWVSLQVNGKTVVRRSKFGDGTGFMGIKSGRYRYAVADEREAILSGEWETQPRERYSVVIAPGNSARKPAQAVIVPLLDSPRDRVRLTFVQAVGMRAGVDLLMNNIVAIPSAKLGGDTRSMLLIPGNYELKANPAGNPRFSYAEASLRAEPGKSYVVLLSGGVNEGASGRTNDDPVALRVYEVK